MKKIKESGFTLIELLGTIVIIGILGTIAVTSVVNIKKSSNIRFDNSQVELMKQAGQTYFTDNKRLLPIVEGQINYVTLDKLIEKGYINKLYNSKKEEFDPTTSYAWVQKQNDGSYKYDCYCEIKGEKLAGTTAIPESKENNSIVTFEYENFYNNKSENKYYTNGKNNSIVKVHLNRNEVSEYRYEIYKKDTKDENSQYKISQREKLTTNLVNIKLNAKDYSDGEYFIKVTTYNSTGNSKQSSSSAKIYVDKTPPTCNITTTYQKDSNSAQKLWYSSKSKNNNNQELGVNSKLPISVDGSDRGSGIKFGSKHIFSDSEYTKQINNETGTYEAENTGKNGKEYYATVEDNVGNKATCSQIYYIDTTPPTCSSKGIEKGNKGNKVQDKQWYLGDVTTYGYFTDENSGVTTEKQLGRKLTKTSKEAQISTITQKDNAGNEGKCMINDIYIDKEKPTCISSGGSNTWKNAASDKKTTLKGTCNDVGSGCVAGSNLERIYDNNGNIYWNITWEGSWTNLSPGTVYDEAGNSTECPGNQTVKHDWTVPTCTSSGGSNTWVNTKSQRRNTTLKGTCNDTGSGCVKGYETGKRFDTEGNVYWDITWEGNWTNLSPGTVHDKAGNSTECPRNQTVKHDWTKPTCSITTDYVTDKNGWYSSNSKNKTTSKLLGVNSALPINISGTDENSGVKSLNGGSSSGTFGINSKSYTKTLDVPTKYVSSDKDSKEYSATITDEAGNTSNCTNTFKVDTVLPSCNIASEYSLDPNGEVVNGTKIWYSSNSKNKNNQKLGENNSLPIIVTGQDDMSNVHYIALATGRDTKNNYAANKTTTKLVADNYSVENTDSKGSEKKFLVVDNAGNTQQCSKTFYVDTKKPTCGSSSGGSDTWINKNSGIDNVILTGNCTADDGSGCGENVTKTVSTLIDGDNNISPGKVMDKAGNESNDCPTQKVRVDKNPPNCNPGGNVAGWTNQKLTLTGTCFDSVSGCNPLKTNVTSSVTTEISNDNYSYGEVEDNAGNIGYCSVAVHTDYSEPKCNNKQLVRGNGTAISENTWLKINKAKYTADCVDTGGSNCIQTSYSTETTNEGTTILKIVISDNAGNVHNCESKTVKIDRTAPGLSATALNQETNFSKSGCGTSDNCQLFYGNIEKKNRGIKLTANNNTGASDHSPIADWGAQAKYETGGTNCAWGDGIDYKWSGQAVCASPGSGKVKRCYKVKDAAGNQSDRVCTCQGPKGGISIKKPSDCF